VQPAVSTEPSEAGDKRRLQVPSEPLTVLKPCPMAHHSFRRELSLHPLTQGCLNAPKIDHLPNGPSFAVGCPSSTSLPSIKGSDDADCAEWILCWYDSADPAPGQPRAAARTDLFCSPPFDRSTAARDCPYASTGFTPHLVFLDRSLRRDDVPTSHHLVAGRATHDSAGGSGLRRAAAGLGVTFSPASRGTMVRSLRMQLLRTRVARHLGAVVRGKASRQQGT
jgi:hypothetical protein